MKAIVLTIILICCVNISYAEIYTTKDCLDKVILGSKAWQVVKYCGKPDKASQRIVSEKKKKNYVIYQYTLQEPICYTQSNQSQVICNAQAKGDVTLYFDNRILVMAEINHKKVNNLFLRFNQKIVLGSTEQEVISLWGKPNRESSKKLTIPMDLEYWHYNHTVFTIKNGLVTNITAVSKK